MNTDKPITLSVVMPAYNEGQHIMDNLLTTSNIDYFVCTELSEYWEVFYIATR